jgi:ABC-type glycerol-3-phosphate transport system substrate-binding protein
VTRFRVLLVIALLVAATAGAGCVATTTAAPTPAVTVVTPVPTASAPFVRDRGIPYFDKTNGTSNIVYDPVGDETEVRVAIQAARSTGVPILEAVRFDDPDDRLVVRLHTSDCIAHITAVRPGGINYWAIPA